MDANRIKQLKLASPFRPFFILLKDGERFFVERSSSVAVAPDGSRIGATNREGVRFFLPDEVRDVDVQGPPLRA